MSLVAGRRALDEPGGDAEENSGRRPFGVQVV